MGLSQHELIACHAYIYGLPIVEGHQTLVSYAALNAGLARRVRLGPMGEKRDVYGVQNGSSLPPTDGTTCSFIWLDLRAEPFVLHPPAADLRGTYSIHLIDLYMRRFGYVTPQLPRSPTSHFLLVGPNWYGDVPLGIDQVFRSGTSLVQVIHRGWRPLENRPGVASRATAADFFEPISSFLKRDAPPAPAAPQWPYHYLDVAGTLDFFAHLDFLLQFCPPLADEGALMARFAEISVGPSGSFQLHRLAAAEKGRLRRGIARGDHAIADALNQIEGVSELFEPAATTRRDYLKQAAAAKVGIYGASAQDAYYLPRNGYALDPNIVALPLFYGFRMGPRRKPDHGETEAHTEKRPSAAPRPATAASGHPGPSSRQGTASAAVADTKEARDGEETDSAPADHTRASPGPARIRYRSARIIQQLNVDSEGLPLDGHGRYLLHFDKARLPPVNDFWSVTARDVRGLISLDQLSSNPLRDASAMKYNPDGSLDIYLQPQSPGPEFEPNWLATKPGRFYVLLRLYAPRRVVLTGAWSAPEIQRLG